MTGEIHEEHPFLTPETERDPTRRFRGRLAAPVTIITSGDAAHSAGLTVSSLVVAEGEPARVYFLVSTTTELHAAMETSGRFVVHVCEQHHRALADVFAGLRPSPGGPFAGVALEESPWGPVMADFAARAYCTYQGGVEETFSFVASGSIDHFELGDISDPLLYFRGRYRELGPPPDPP